MIKASRQIASVITWNFCANISERFNRSIWSKRVRFHSLIMAKQKTGNPSLYGVLEQNLRNLTPRNELLLSFRSNLFILFLLRHVKIHSGAATSITPWMLGNELTKILALLLCYVCMEEFLQGGTLFGRYLWAQFKRRF